MIFGPITLIGYFFIVYLGDHFEKNNKQVNLTIKKNYDYDYYYYPPASEASREVANLTERKSA